MTQMTPSQARVIDPILTTVAQGYQNSEIGRSRRCSRPCRSISAAARSSSSAARIFASTTRRARRAATKRLDIGYIGRLLRPHQTTAWKARCRSSCLRRPIACPASTSAASRSRRCRTSSACAWRRRRPTSPPTPASYGAANKVTLSGTDQWSDYSGTSNPSTTSRPPSRPSAPQSASARTPWSSAPPSGASCSTHPKVIDRIKYTGRDSVTPELLATLFGVKQRPGRRCDLRRRRRRHPVDLWGKNVVVAYTDVGGAWPTVGLPSYGYTYRLRGYPVVEQAVPGPQRQELGLPGDRRARPGEPRQRRLPDQRGGGLIMAAPRRRPRPPNPVKLVALVATESVRYDGKLTFRVPAAGPARRCRWPDRRRPRCTRRSAASTAGLSHALRHPG